MELRQLSYFVTVADDPRLRMIPMWPDQLHVALQASHPPATRSHWR